MLEILIESRANDTCMITFKSFSFFSLELLIIITELNKRAFQTTTEANGHLSKRHETILTAKTRNCSLKFKMLESLTITFFFNFATEASAANPITIPFVLIQFPLSLISVSKRPAPDLQLLMALLLMKILLCSSQRFLNLHT